MSSQKFSIYFFLIIFPSIQIRMSCNTGDSRNLSPGLKSELGLYHFVLTTPEVSPEKLTLTVVEMQHLRDIENTDSKKRFVD